MLNSTPDPIVSGFSGLGLLPQLLKVLEAAHFSVPTPIQADAIPHGVTGGDIIGIAQTGTGKTLAFSLPMLQYLIQHPGTRGLVVLPTRELALQVEETVQKLGRSLGISSVVLIGGASMHNQIQHLKTNPRVIIATPGRLNDHIGQGTVRLDKVAVAVLDEADRMLDMGFKPQIEKIMERLPEQRQTMLFSATMPQEIASIAAKYQKNPKRVEVARAGTVTDQVTHELCILSKDRKRPVLEEILKDYTGTVLVFSRTKHGAKKLTEQVLNMGHATAEIHANRSLAQRRQALDGFKTGRYRVLVATDIAARGIDVSGIQLVVNYDLPDAAEDYVHRIGRTGRAGLTGHAISFATPDQFKDVKDIEKLLGEPLKPSSYTESQLDPRLRNMEKLESGRRGNARGQQIQGQRGDRERGNDQRPSGPHEERPQHSQPSHGDAQGRPSRHGGGQAQHSPAQQGGRPAQPAQQGGGGKRARRPGPPPKNPFPEVAQTSNGYFMRRSK